MVAGAAWADVRTAFQSLKVKTRKRPEFNSLNKLSSVLVKLESSLLDPKLVTEISAYLRQELVLLYKVFLSDTVHLSSALFDCIQTQKAAKSDFLIQRSWEHVQKSILSGILDYLEETQSSNTEIHETIADHMFTVLCRYFFPPESSANYEEISIELKTTVYILLSDTVKNHKSLQSKLRDPKLLGGARFGLELARVRAYLHLEALFELFEKLVPDNTDECNLFIDSVFNPALFSRHRELKSIVASLKHQTWDELFPIVAQIFAQMSIKFPQPIAITDATLSDTSPCCPSETIYVDQRGLTYNIDVDDAIDTCHIAYHNIRKIRYSRYSQTSVMTTTFNFELANPPTVGKDVPEPRAVTLTLSVPRHKRDVFLDALKARGLASLFDQTERKISLAASDGPLDFSNQPVEPSQSFPEKTQKILREMTPSDKILVPSSSPLSRKLAPVQGNVDLPEPTRPPGKPPKKGRKIVQSDNELEEESPQRKMIKPLPPQNHTGQPDAKGKVVTSLEREVRQNVDQTTGKIGVYMGVYKISPFMLLSLESSTQSKESSELLSKGTGSKRKATEEDPNRSSKRPRSDLDSTPIKSPLSSKTLHRAKRYGKRERGPASTPTPVENSCEDDLDSIPKPSTIKTIAKPTGRTRNTGSVATLMKAKMGKDNITLTTKSKANARDKPPQKTKTKTKHEPIAVDDAKPTRRSARVAGKPIIEMEGGPQVENVGQAQEDETRNKAVAKAIKGNDGKVTRNSRPKPKTIVNKKRLAEEIEVTEQPVLEISKYTNHYRNEIEIQPPAGPNALKVKKDKKAPWEKIGFAKQREEPAIPSPSKSISKSEPTSGIDLPMQIPLFEDFGHSNIDIEVPLKPGSDESLDTNAQPSPDLRKNEKHIELETIDLTLDSPIEEKRPKVSKLTVNAVPITHDVRASIVRDAQPRKLASGSKPRRTPSLIEISPQGTEQPRRNEFAGSHSPVPFVSVAPSAVTAPLQAQDPFITSTKPRLDQFSVTGKQTSTVLKNPKYDSGFLPHSLKLPKVSPAVALLRRTALDITKNTQVSTPLRHAPEKTTFEPPSNIKRVHQQQHVAFSPLPQLPPHTGSVVVRRWEIDQREHGRAAPKLRDTHKSSKDLVVGTEPHKYRNNKGTALDEKNAEIRDIVEVLNDIQKVLIKKITNRFDGVKKEVRVGRDSILRAAAADIDKMRAESAIHYNALVDLEAEYASFRRYVNRHLEDLCSVDKDVVGRVTDIIQHHDRYGLSKRFPKSLPQVPACFLNLSKQ
ncbi:hypothetical protein GGU10DRAFT_398883 [Lentinula aff. detonsa]|uniref:Uncharacterized protein n=1 Tax=Lentinula aff. detonsa TaxID=2804958 RepID=A0AA38NJ88_9AGAR|nr:hypothetical protein GGU10DRAFT_398883 [Lentinula aff. detonsa]